MLQTGVRAVVVSRHDGRTRGRTVRVAVAARASSSSAAAITPSSSNRLCADPVRTRNEKSETNTVHIFKTASCSSWREQRSGSAGLSSRSLHRRHTGSSVSGGGGAPSPNDVPLPTLATAATDAAATTTTTTVAESVPRNASRPLANVDASSTANKSSHQGDRAGQPVDRWSSGREDPLATAVGSSHRSPPSHGSDEVVGAPAHQTGVGDVDREAQCAAEREHEHSEGHHGVTVASIRWNFVSVPFVFTVFIILAGFTKIVFHHANFLSSIVPESCMLILLGTNGRRNRTHHANPWQSEMHAQWRKPDGWFDACVIAQHSATMRHRVTHSDYVPNFSPDLFFLFLLPPIILESAYSLHDSAFFSNIGTILLFAVLGTIINAFTIGPSLYFLNNVGAIGLPNLNLLECLVFSSLISAVDPVAVLAIFQEVGVNKVLYFLVFGESLLNDAVTVVLYNMMVGVFRQRHHGQGNRCGLRCVPVGEPRGFGDRLRHGHDHRLRHQVHARRQGG
ncbi:hypothetical protein MTO96_009466 [Rhipicephalus appendiculatus]